MLFRFQVQTNSQTCFIDITTQLTRIVRESGVKGGLLSVFIPHTTAAVTINENADPDVKADMIKEMNKVIPFKDDYRHAEGNSAAHLKASLFGFSTQIIFEKGELLLGTWQGVYFCEFDGPRNRTVQVKLISG